MTHITVVGCPTHDFPPVGCPKEILILPSHLSLSRCYREVIDFTQATPTGQSRASSLQGARQLFLAFHDAPVVPLRQARRSVSSYPCMRSLKPGLRVSLLCVKRVQLRAGALRWQRWRTECEPKEMNRVPGAWVSPASSRIGYPYGCRVIPRSVCQS